MPVVQIISQRHNLLIPSIVPGLVASDQKDGDAPWVESVQHSIGSPRMLNPHSLMCPWRESKTPEL